ncbi:ATP-dependent zinc protease family protein [Faunimonas sp. B44]|uniref:ATP-dependent zinc protease family protein n=1 Tax=Faunimonas sp. B44 TaxID=3461493 RepID=UPI004043A7C6
MTSPKIFLAGDPRISALSRSADKPPGGPLVIGWREWASLPGLGIGLIHAKIDTGAKTSSLHAGSIEPFDKDGAPYVRFDVTGEGADTPWHEAKIVDRRQVRSSNGGVETRYVIRCDLGLADRVWPIELSLTNRERMDLPMLIGREALAGRALVDAARSWLCGRPDFRRRATRARRSAKATAG